MASQLKFEIAVSASFDLCQAVCSYGFFIQAPNVWDLQVFNIAQTVTHVTWSLLVSPDHFPFRGDLDCSRALGLPYVQYVLTADSLPLKTSCQFRRQHPPCDCKPECKQRQVWQSDFTGPDYECCQAQRSQAHRSSSKRCYLVTRLSKGLRKWQLAFRLPLHQQHRAPATTLSFLIH